MLAALRPLVSLVPALVPFVVGRPFRFAALLPLVSLVQLVLLVPFAYLLSVGALDWGPVKDIVQRMPGPLLRSKRAVFDPTARPGEREEEAA